MAIDFPNSPSTNDVHTVGSRSWVWDGSTWRASVKNFGFVAQTSAPTSPDTGDLWFDTNSGRLYVYYDSTWVEEVGAPSTQNANALTGTTLASNVLYSSMDGRRRNRVVNGDFQVWQRGGGSFTTQAYCADQYLLVVTGSTHTVTRQTFTLGNAIPGYEPTYYMRSVVSSSAGAANRAFIQIPMEGVRTLAGQTATVSFWAKADAARPIAYELEQYFGSGGSPSANTLTFCAKPTLSTSWARYSTTVTVPSISGKTLGTDGKDKLMLGIWYDAGSDYAARTNTLGQQSGTFEIWGVQVEAGPVATPFEVIPYQEQLSMCQRYYRRWVSSGGSTYSSFGLGFANATNAGKIFLVLDTPMKFHPALSSSGTFRLHWGGAASNVTAMTLSATESSDRFLMLDVSPTGSPMTAKDTLILQASLDSTVWLAVSAEF